MNCKLHSSVSPVVRLTSAVLAASAKLGTPGQECPKVAVSQDRDAHGAFVSKTDPERVHSRNVDEGTCKEYSIFLRPAHYPTDCYYLERPYF